MLDQVHSILQAAEILVDSVGTPQERLAKGFKAFRRATILSTDWSAALWEKYDFICDILLAGGTWQKTIAGMDPKTASECASQVSEVMKDLAIAVAVARNKAVLLPSATTPQSVSAPSGNPERTRGDQCARANMTNTA